MPHSYITHPITIVTAYYKFKTSKRSHSQYKKYMKNFLSHIAIPVVIFTEESCLDYIISVRKKYMYNTIIIVKDFTRLNEYSRYEMWKQEHKKDPEKKIHNPDLYVIWNEKIHFIREAYILNSFRSEWFIWMDIGAFRNKKQFQDLTLSEIDKWPSLQKIQTLPKNKMIFIQVNSEFNISHYTNAKENLATLQLKTHNHVGGLFIIHSSIIPTIHSLYYQLINDRQQQDMFVGKEQNIYACMAIGYPEYVCLLQVPENVYPWFYMHHYLSESHE